MVIFYRRFLCCPQQVLGKKSTNLLGGDDMQISTCGSQVRNGKPPKYVRVLRVALG